jgi:hypothetical protein
MPDASRYRIRPFNLGPLPLIRGWPNLRLGLSLLPRLTSGLPVALAHYLLLFFLVLPLAWPISAAAEILNFDCAVNGLAIALHVDTETQTVQQIARSEYSSEVGEYSDGVYGPVSHNGAAAFIPRVHQFVLISEAAIQFGAEFRGMRDVAVVDRRLGTLTLPRGQSGWCFQR